MALKRSKEHRNKLKKIAKEMSRRNERVFPVTPPIIDALDFILDRDEVDYLIQLQDRDYTYEELMALSAKSSDEFRKFSKLLQKKGFLEETVDKEGNDYWSLSPVGAGWVEMAMFYYMGRPEEREFHKLIYFEVFEYFKKYNRGPFRGLINRSISALTDQKLLKPNNEVLPFPGDVNKTIPIDKSLENPAYEIYPRKTINELIEERAQLDALYTMPCICRTAKKNVYGKPCSFGIEAEDSCLFFGDRGFGYNVTKIGIGRKISKQQALDILHKTSKKGAVHTIFHEKDDIFTRSEVGICNCCPDCCGLYRAFNAGAMPGLLKSYYYASVVNLHECTGCKNCVKYCPTQAIALIKDSVHINKDRCIGCAQCTIQCAGNNVITMVPETRDVILPLLGPAERRYE
jgi:Pyruvate/2-oxoacid:ferredoxin oxidoreductase delta subunit